MLVAAVVNLLTDRLVIGLHQYSRYKVLIAVYWGGVFQEELTTMRWWWAGCNY